MGTVLLKIIAANTAQGLDEVGRVSDPYESTSKNSLKSSKEKYEKLLVDLFTDAARLRYI